MWRSVSAHASLTPPRRRDPPPCDNAVRPIIRCDRCGSIRSLDGGKFVFPLLCLSVHASLWPATQHARQSRNRNGNYSRFPITGDVTYELIEGREKTPLRNLMEISRRSGTFVPFLILFRLGTTVSRFPGLMSTIRGSIYFVNFILKVTSTRYWQLWTSDDCKTRQNWTVAIMKVGSRRL